MTRVGAGCWAPATRLANAIAVSVGCAIVAAIVWFPFGITLYDALGHVSIAIIALLMALLATTFAPPFFPGGDIGRLSVCGTVNDLAMMGATRPLGLTCSLVIEEGFPRHDLATRAAEPHD